MYMYCFSEGSTYKIHQCRIDAWRGFWTGFLYNWWETKHPPEFFASSLSSYCLLIFFEVVFGSSLSLSWERNWSTNPSNPFAKSDLKQSNLITFLPTFHLALLPARPPPFPCVSSAGQKTGQLTHSLRGAERWTEQVPSPSPSQAGGMYIRAIFSL